NIHIYSLFLILTSISHNFLLFLFNTPATTEIYTLSLHDALPILITAKLLTSSPSIPVDHLLAYLEYLSVTVQRYDCIRNKWIYRSEEHTSELQSLRHLVCRLLLEKKKK